MTSFFSINTIAEICFKKGITEAIVCPGSRSAPLTLAFTRHPKINTRIISDERPAAFIAMGIALAKKEPVVLICTSGSAPFNFSPAVTEAFFQHIPLLILTADRPPEWIAQQDNQTTFQQNIYGKHVKANFDIPVDTTHADSQWHLERIISEAINTCAQETPGPVHINIPLRDNLYPTSKDDFFPHNQSVKIIEEIKSTSSLDEKSWKKIINEWNANEKKIILIGQQSTQPELINLIEKLEGIPILGDITSNIHLANSIIDKQELILIKEKNNQELKPDLLITFGGTILSKNIKTFLRKYKPNQHWHIQSAGSTADTFQSLTHVIQLQPTYFLEEIIKRSKKTNQIQQAFHQQWEEKNKKINQSLDTFFSSSDQSFSELEAVKIILDSIPSDSILHLGNSMPVRYANLVNKLAGKKIEIQSNRGTSGIDGCLSTAVGYTMSTTKLNVLLIGDMSFFYDRNGLWHNYMPPNLRIVVLNNHGGIIFRFIEGPSTLPELEEYFETHQPLNAKQTATDFNLDYIYCTQRDTLQKNISSFFQLNKKAKILEIETDKKTNENIYHQFKNHITL